MPQVTVYIRTEDLDKWRAIEKKSEWISNHLSLHNSPLMNREASEVPKIIKTKQDAKKVVDEITYKKTGNWGA